MGTGNGLETQPGNSYFSRVCVIHFLVNLSRGLSGNVTTAPKSPKGKLGPLRLVSPVASRTHLGLPRCRSIRNGGGHSRGLDQPVPAARLSPRALQMSQRGFKNSGFRAQVHPLPPPATRWPQLCHISLSKQRQWPLSVRKTQTDLPVFAGVEYLSCRSQSGQSPNVTFGWG